MFRREPVFTMNFYKMRAFTLTGELYSFSISDVPTRISATEFILALKPDSPILLSKHIMRGLDIDNLFEGDIISSGGEKYVVNYMRGFRATSEKGELKYLYEFDDYEVIGNVFTMDFPIRAPLRKTMVFKYRNSKIQIKDITGIYKGYVVVKGLTVKLDPTELQQEAGFSYKGDTVFFGDLIEGCPVHLYKGRLVIQKADGIYDLIKEQYIGGN